MASTILPNLRRARDLADNRFAEPLDLEALAAHAGVSKYHFSRRFAETYGETPMRYVSRRRIERAQELLRSANLSVTEISHLVGYSSLGSFIQRFSALVGVSPAIYRGQTAPDSQRIPGCYLFMAGVDTSNNSNLGEA